MLRYALIFLIIALIAGAFGFTGTGSLAYTIAKVLFVLFIILLFALLTRSLADCHLDYGTIQDARARVTG